jgi:membrane protein
MTELHWIPWSRQLAQVLRCTVTEWFAHRATSKGAALAFYTLFSIAPVLVVVIAVAGFFYGDEAARQQLFIQLENLVGRQSAEAIGLVLAGAQNERTGRIATIVATLLLLFGATTVFAELKASLDEIWNVPPPDYAPWQVVLRTRLLSFGLILVLGFLLLVSLVVSAVLGLLHDVLSDIWGDATVLLSWLASLVSFLVIAVLFGVIYKMLPRVKLSWRDVLIGALGTAVLFTLGKYLIGLYIGNSGVASSYGAAGSMIALLLWVFFSAQIFFLGAEFTRQYALRMGSLRTKQPPSPSASSRASAPGTQPKTP